MLADYRAMVLRKAQWHDTGDPAAYADWQTARDGVPRSRRPSTRRDYAGDPYYPAYNLTAAHLGLERADRDLPMAWAARRAAACWCCCGSAYGARRRRLARGSRAWPGARLARAHRGSPAPAPGGRRRSTADLGRADRVLLVAVPAVALVLSRCILTWFAAPAHLVVTLGRLARLRRGRAAAGAGARRPHAGRSLADPSAEPPCSACCCCSFALVPTGPGGYWFGFWTDPVARSALRDRRVRALRLGAGRRRLGARAVGRRRAGRSGS